MQGDDDGRREQRESFEVCLYGCGITRMRGRRRGGGAVRE